MTAWSPTFRRPRLLAALAVVVGACALSANQNADPYDSVARVAGQVCGKDMVGTAVVIDRGLLVTVAHNVAGSEGGLSVTLEDGVRHAATLVGMDIHRDLALLASPNLEGPAILMADSQPGEEGRIVRLRGESERAEVPFTQAELVTAVGTDIYDAQSSVRRSNVRVRATVGAGYSGGPILNQQDEMIGLVYATARFDDVAYAVTSAEIDSFLDSVDPTTAANPGRCPR